MNYSHHFTTQNGLGGIFWKKSVFLTRPNKDDALYQAVIELANIYSADLSSNFQCQLLSVCQIPRGEISKLDTIKDLVELLISKHIMTSIPD